MFEPKPFQKETIKKLAGFLEAARFDGPRAAFENAPKEVPSEWRKPYVPLDKLAETPYVCLRLPTGGGKTFLAARAVPSAETAAPAHRPTSRRPRVPAARPERLQPARNEPRRRTRRK